jgi:hypothetical protein
MARNVIPHVKEIHSIVEGLATLAGDTGTVVIEFHYAKTIAEELHYDSIYHEHLFYFSIKSLGALFGQYGLWPFDVFRSPISGGSVVLFLSSKQKQASQELTDLIETEERTGLNTLDIWQQFGVASKKHAAALNQLVKKYSNKEKLIGYGASARSSTLLHFAGLSNKDIEYVIDRSQLKHDRYTPGTAIPILSFEKGLVKAQGKDLLLLAWNFENEIVRDLREANFHGDIIVPLPGEVHLR